MPLDADSKSYLEDVKKGRPRRFVMVCKGVQIQSLIVYKKGTVEKYKKQAKEEGKGQFYHGVIDGKGADICFKLLSTDGYEKPPGKEHMLKDFLKTEAGMMFKPTYAIVDVLPEVDESDDGAVAPEAPPVSAAVPQAPPVDGTAFAQRLTALLPDLKRALAANSPLAEQLKTTAAKAQALGKEKKFAEAMPALGELEKLVQSALASGPTVAPTAPPPAKSPSPASQEAKGFSIVNAQASRLAWDSTRKKVQAELQNLEKAILAAVDQHNDDEAAADEYEMSEVAAGAKQLYTILDALDTRLIDKLDEALNADGEARAALHKEAKEIIKEYQQFVASDPLMAVIDNNPFVDATIRQTVDRTLGVLASKI